MKVTSNGYLDARGVSVMLYDSAFSPVFFDQKDAGMQIILHGNRVATNGSLRLLATPEQWDAIPTIKAHQPDQEHDRLTADLSYPDYHLDYHVVIAAEPGGNPREREPRSAAAGESGRPRRLQSRVPALNLHG
ncbi:MAG: hypothetical protein WCE63_01270 [Acidobacteriaceae bacterium]